MTLRPPSMTEAETTLLGIDPTYARLPFTFVAFEQSGRLQRLSEGELEQVLEFVVGLPRAMVAINSPSRPSTGALIGADARGELTPLHQPGRGTEMRVVEHQLRERGISVGATPREFSAAPNWMQLGFGLYEKLTSLGFRPFPTEGASHQWIETHPHAVFCALLGQLPLPRHTLEGRIQRQLVLREKGLGIVDPMEFFDEITRHGILRGELPNQLLYEPAVLDALAAAYTAFQVVRSPQSITTLGSPEEGIVFLPVEELKAHY